MQHMKNRCYLGRFWRTRHIIICLSTFGMHGTFNRINCFPASSNTSMFLRVIVMISLCSIVNWSLWRKNPIIKLFTMSLRRIITSLLLTSCWLRGCIFYITNKWFGQGICSCLGNWRSITHFPIICSAKRTIKNENQRWILVRYYVM